MRRDAPGAPARPRSRTRDRFDSSKRLTYEQCRARMFETEANLARSLPTAGDTPALDPSEAQRALLGPLDHLIRTQAEDGSWHGDYGGPLFLLPLYVATCRIAGLELDPDTAREMLRYLRTHQNADGGFGLHVEASSAVFPSALNYVAA